MLKNLYLTTPVGQSVRDFLVLGMVDRLLDLLPDFRIVILSPSYNVPAFLDLCPKHERAMARRMELPVAVSNRRLMHWRRKLHNRAGIKLMLALERRRVKLPHYLADTFREMPPSLVVSTHPMLHFDYEVVTWARRLGIQTLGVVKSWDNILKTLSCHCHLLSVWNPVNKREAVRLLRYREDEVTINGSPSFDPYHDPAYNVSREDFFSSLGLDPSRPIVTIATAGPLNKEFYGRDETHLIEDILRMLRQSDVLRKVQLVIRLHPSSYLQNFWKYRNWPGIKISFASRIPGGEWCPTQDDLVEQTNLLRHSDVIITPGSSWVLEAAIFDRPTVVPAYSDLQPDHAAALFDRWTFTRHFRLLVESNCVQVTRSYQETKTALEEALTTPQKYAAGRKSIVDEYVYYSDNRSSQRVAEWIANIARTAKPGKLQGF